MGVPDPEATAFDGTARRDIRAQLQSGALSLLDLRSHTRARIVSLLLAMGDVVDASARTREFIRSMCTAAATIRSAAADAAALAWAYATARSTARRCESALMTSAAARGIVRPEMLTTPGAAAAAAAPPSAPFSSASPVMQAVSLPGGRRMQPRFHIGCLLVDAAFYVRHQYHRCLHLRLTVRACSCTLPG
jgi:hypothetical protein